MYMLGPYFFRTPMTQLMKFHMFLSSTYAYLHMYTYRKARCPRQNVYKIQCIEKKKMPAAPCICACRFDMHVKFTLYMYLHVHVHVRETTYCYTPSLTHNHSTLTTRHVILGLLRRCVHPQTSPVTTRVQISATTSLSPANTFYN